MRKPRGFGALAAVGVAGMLVFSFACGGDTTPGDAPAEEAPAGESTSSPPPATGAAAQPPASAAGRESWADVPVPPAASELEESASQQPVSGRMQRYRTLHFRTYETTTGIDVVNQFYLDKMPEHGWMKVVSQRYDRPPSAMSAWVKDAGEVADNVSVGEDQGSGKTYITLMRGEDVD